MCKSYFIKLTKTKTNIRQCKCLETRIETLIKVKLKKSDYLKTKINS